MKSPIWLRWLPALLLFLTAAEFLVFEYDSRQHVRALSGRGRSVLAARG